MNVESDWQTWTALGVVGVTLLIVLSRCCRKKRGGGCSSCGPDGCNDDS